MTGTPMMTARSGWMPTSPGWSLPPRRCPASSGTPSRCSCAARAARDQHHTLHPGPTSRDRACRPGSGGVRLVPGDLDRGRVKRAGRPLAREVQCDRHQRLDHRARVSRPKGGIWRSRGRASRDGAPPPAASTPPNPPSTSPSALTTTFHRVGWHTSARPDPGRVRRDQLGKPSRSAHQGPVFPGPPPGAIKPQIAHRLRVRVDAQPGGIAIAGG